MQRGSFETVNMAFVWLLVAFLWLEYAAIDMLQIFSI